MNFYCNNHQGKADVYIQALEDAGHERFEHINSSSFGLIDIDFLARKKYIDHYQNTGEPVFLYPHTGRPVLQWDGMYEPHPYVTAIFTTAQGGIDIPRMYGFTKTPMYAVGWTYCEMKEFQPCKSPKKVLYAPIHVNGNGFMTKRERLTNAKVFKKLLGIKGIELTVRYLHYLEWNGLWEEGRVTYIQGEPDQSTKEIDEADVVVSHQNMGYLSVARGKPTLFMEEGNVPISGSHPDNIKTVSSWNKYKKDLMFPLDIMSKEDGRTLINKAGTEDVSKWRERFIGNPFDAREFVEKVERYLG